MQRNAGSLQKPKKAGKLIPSQSLQKECSLANPFQIFYLQNHEIINLCCFRPSNLWSFETVGIENLYSVLTCGHISLLPVHDLSVLVTQLCLTLFNPMECIFQAKILEWVTIPFSRESSQPRDQTQVSHTAGRFFTSRATREAQEYWSDTQMKGTL